MEATTMIFPALILCAMFSVSRAAIPARRAAIPARRKQVAGAIVWTPITHRRRPLQQPGTYG
jgi:hypothetical protein